MPVYRYKAMDVRSRPLAGSLAAESPRHARDLLRSRGLAVESLRLQTAARRPAAAWLLQGRGHSARLASLLRELATLLSVGVGIVEALETLSRQHRGYFQAALALLRDRIAGGE